MADFYQHLPEMINPVVFSLGNFAVRWYSIMYLVGFIVFYALLDYRLRKGEFKNANKELVVDFLVYSFFGLMIGARLGYVLFYDLNYFLNDPLAVVSPFDSRGNFVGIFGMSYFGGLTGIIISTWIFCRRKKIDIWKWSDFFIPAISAGYFFGRIGNFLNGELYGKITKSQLGMYFSADPYQLRYPTQLLEALLEGIALFFILWFLRNKVKFSGQLLSFYLIGYGIIRFFIEFLRETEQSQFVGAINISQIMALIVIIIGVFLFFRKRYGLPPCFMI